jgi:uncharacterized protein YjhX (UPF0386 family)
VVFAKRRSRRTPLQRLSDQRRSLALGGLAIGAVFGTAFFRRRRHGEEVRFEAPAPPTMKPDASGTGEPEFDEAPQPINAAPRGESAAVAETTPSTLEPATGELSAEEARILAVLAQSGRVDDDRTAIAVAASLEREVGDVTDVLRKLGAEGVVSGGLRTSAGEEIWAVTERGVRRLGAQS